MASGFGKDEGLYHEVLEELKASFAEVSESEKIRLENERDFLKNLLSNAGLGRSDSGEYSKLFLLDAVDRFFQPATTSSFLV